MSHRRASVPTSGWHDLLHVVLCGRLQWQDRPPSCPPSDHRTLYIIYTLLYVTQESEYSHLRPTWPSPPGSLWTPSVASPTPIPSLTIVRCILSIRFFMSHRRASIPTSGRHDLLHMVLCGRLQWQDRPSSRPPSDRSTQSTGPGGKSGVSQRHSDVKGTVTYSVYTGIHTAKYW